MSRPGSGRFWKSVVDESAGEPDIANSRSPLNRMIRLENSFSFINWQANERDEKYLLLNDLPAGGGGSRVLFVSYVQVCAFSAKVRIFALRKSFVLAWTHHGHNLDTDK